MPTDEHTRAFQVPQLRLAGAAGARRVNRQLLQLVLGANADVDAAAPAGQQLQQAARACCYDAQARQWQGWQGLTACSYRVLFNRAGLLSLEITLEFTGAYSWEKTAHYTFDLRTGRLLALADVVATPPAQLRQRMRRAVNLRLGEVLAETQQEFKGDTATINDVARQLRWSWKTHQTNAGATADLTEFGLTPGKLLLFYRAGFPHPMLNFEPDAAYRFAYPTLQLTPRLQRALGQKPAPGQARK